MDIVSTIKRKQMMAGIRGKNTRPEVMIRKDLFRRGFRYRLHGKNIPGCPDLVLRQYNAVIFINGCFWHGHGCHLFKWPQAHAEFWREKIGGNMERDQRNLSECVAKGYRIAVVWECALKGKERRLMEEVLSILSEWLYGEDQSLEIPGKQSEVVRSSWNE